MLHELINQDGLCKAQSDAAGNCFFNMPIVTLDAWFVNGCSPIWACNSLRIAEGL
jgi:hypothetical protein